MSSEQPGSSSPLTVVNGSAAASSPAPRQSVAGPSSDAAAAPSTQPSFTGVGIAKDSMMRDAEANGAEAGESDGEQEEGDEEEAEEEAEEEEAEEEESGDDDEGSEEEEDDDDDEGSDSGESSRSMATGDGEERGVEAALGGDAAEAAAATAVPAADANGQPAPHAEGSAAAATQGAEGAADAAAAAPQDGSDPAAGPSDPTIHKPKVKKRRRQNRTPSPGTMLPEGPPPRPSTRMTLTPLPVGRDTGVDYKDYIVSVPDLLYDTLKAAGQSDPWMSYWEKKRREAEEAEAAKVAAAAPPPEVPNDIPADLPPELAALLAKHQETGPVKKKRKRRQMKEDQYDPKDPFVDDSELQYDEPTHSAKPDSDGFFVQEGAVSLETISKKPRKAHAPKAADGAAPALSAAAVLNAATSAAVLYGIGTSCGIRGSTTGSSAAANRMLAKRALDRGLLPPMPPKREKPAPERSASMPRAGGAMGLGNLLNGGPSEGASPSRSPAPFGDDSRRSVSRMSEGTRAAPIDIDDDDDVSITEKVLAKHEKALEGTEIKNRVYRSDPRMLTALDELKVLIDAQDWSTKGRFPPLLKPALVKVSRLALDLGEYNENFFSWMPHLFPYNRFTMHKLIKREFYIEHHSYLKLLQSEHMQLLEQSLRDDLPAHQADYAAAVAAWEHRGSPSRDAAAANGAAPDAAPAGGDVSMANGEEGHEVAAAEGGPPEKKWRFSDDQRHQICICVVIEDAMAQVQAEKIGFEKGEVPTTIIMARKNLYARLAELLPEPGWSTSTQISREFANLKRRFLEALGTEPKLDQ